jgi:hypothetical protein
MAVPQTSNLRHQLFGAWSAPIFSVLTVGGWLGIAHFWRPAAADLTAAQTAHWFQVSHHTGVLIGCSIFLLATCFLAMWTAEMGLLLRELEGRSPIMAIGQVLAGVSIVVIVVINCSLWLGAAYRPGSNPQIAQALNDAAWLGFLIAWPLLSMQMLCVAVVALHDHRARPLFPRRASWASIVGAVLLVTAGGAAFTHSGPFAFHGVLGFYLPVVIWAAWLDGHAFYMRRELRGRLQAALAGQVPGGAGAGAADGPGVAGPPVPAGGPAPVAPRARAGTAGT